MESFWSVHREIEMQTTNREEIEKTLKEEEMLRITPEGESPHYCTNSKDILSGISQII